MCKIRKEDMENMATKKNITDYEWVKNNMQRITIKIHNKSGIVAALEDYISIYGGSKNSICINAVAEFLKKQGFDPENYKTR